MKNILISDPTLRDGNHAAKHDLPLDVYIEYCENAESAGVPIVEAGHGNGLGASSMLVGECSLDDETILKNCRAHLKNTKLGIHVIPGFATIKSNLSQAIDLGVDVFRIASHCTEADITKNHIGYLRKNNKTVYGVLMMSHLADIQTLIKESLKMQDYGAEAVIIMDSAGFYLPDDVRNRIRLLKESLVIDIGFHGHNNLGMGIYNAVAAVEEGATILDGSIKGYGAGAGNTQLEVLIAVLHRMGYDTGVNLDELFKLVSVLDKYNLNNPVISPLSLVSGIAGVFSGFAKHVLEAANKFNVNPNDIFYELGKRKVVAGQESLIFEVAKILGDKNE